MKGVMNLDNNEKIKDLIKLLGMNQDHLCYELTSLAAKINNFLYDRNRMLSGQLISVMYDSLMEENTDESVEINVSKPVETSRYESIGMDAEKSVEKYTGDILNNALAFEDNRFALV